MRYILIAAASFAIAVSPLVAHSQSAYPTKSIRFIVPVTTGGPSDIVARLPGERLSVSLGKSVVVDNRPGASNTLGAALVAKAEPDGYTLLQAAANMPTIQILMTDLPFDPVKDFTPVSLTHLTPYVFNPDLRKRFGDMGLEVKHSTPEAFGKFLQSEIARWQALLVKKP